MCGRYALSASAQDIALQFGLDGQPEAFLPSDWNIAPTKPIIFITASDHAGLHRQCNIGLWGLVPHWSKDTKRSANTINARVESVSEKPSFRSAFKARRCLIPADGYYEWATEIGSFAPKQPFYIYRSDEKLLAMAGIYEHWTNPATGQILTTTSILTRESAGTIASIHHRMPVLLPPDRWAHWLSADTLQATQIAEYEELLRVPNPAADLVPRPVSTAVNNVRNNGPELLEPVETMAEMTLFDALDEDQTR